MPSPFPGMDPFVEGQWRQNFHVGVVAAVVEVLVPQVRPKYVVPVEPPLSRADNERMRQVFKKNPGDRWQRYGL